MGEQLDDGFKRYNLFYGWNGSGKTTLSKFFSLLNEGKSDEFGQLKYSIEHTNGLYQENKSLEQKIRVFNRDYIRDNLYFDGAKATKFSLLLGKGNIQLAERIDKNEKKLAQLVEQIRDATKAKDTMDTDKENKFTAAASNTRQIASLTAGYDKRHAKQIFARLTKKEILTQYELDTQTGIVHQNKRDEISEIALPEDLSNHLDEVKKICQKTVASQVRENEIIKRLAANKDIAQWVEDGLQLREKHKNQKCEFCGSVIEPQRIDILLGYFSEADRKLKAKIDDKNLALKMIAEEVRGLHLPTKAEFYSRFVSKFENIEAKFEKEKTKYLNDLQSMIAVLGEKKQKTTEEVSVDMFLSNNFQFVINSANGLVSQHNEMHDNLSREKNNAIELIKKHKLSEIYDDVKRLEDEMGELDKSIANKSTEIEQLKKSIHVDTQEVSSEHQACESLNSSLEAFLGRGDITFAVSDDKEVGYQIERNGSPAENLSEGEKTAIACVYFIERLKEDGFKLKDSIIVVDDPVSSLDDNFLHEAFSFLKEAIEDAAQVFILTHNFHFLKHVIRWLKSKQKGVGFYTIENSVKETGRIAFIANLDENLKNFESEYQYLFNVLNKFVGQKNNDINSSYHIPNNARKVLETFLICMSPKKGTSTRERMKELGLAQRYMAMYDFFNSRSHIGSDITENHPKLVEKHVKTLLDMISKFTTQLPTR